MHTTIPSQTEAVTPPRLGAPPPPIGEPADPATAPLAGPVDLDAIPESGKPRREPFPLPELADFYGLGRIRSVSWLSAGKNEHGEVLTSRGRYFIRRSYRAKSVESMRWQVDLLGRLYEAGLPVTVPLPGRDGDPVAVFDARVYLVTAPLPGTPYDPDRAEHPRATGRMLAHYHRIAEGLTIPDPPDTARESALEGVTERLPLVDAQANPELHHLCTRVAARLSRLWPGLPSTIIHGGCRRGSFLFTGDTITGVLDFDSARRAPRGLDLATAVHDIGKIYTTKDAADHKVALDLARVAEFMNAYRETATVTATEAEAIVALIAAKRAQRALGRAARLQDGEALSDNDLAKITMEIARLAWLEEHAEELAAICGGAARS